MPHTLKTLDQSFGKMSTSLRKTKQWFSEKLGGSTEEADQLSWISPNKLLNRCDSEVAKKFKKQFLERLIITPTVPTPMPKWEQGQKLRKEAQQELNIDTVDHFNIGFIGQCGAGKSTLINAIRQIPDTDCEAAVVGEVQSYSELKRYAMPEHEYINFWDLPAFDGRRDGVTHFLEKKLYAFDMLVVVCGNRFSENDMVISTAAYGFNVPVIFVRSKSDQDIDSRSRRLEKPKPEVKVDLKNAVQGCLAEIAPPELQDRRAFVLSSLVIRGQIDQEDYGIDESNCLRHIGAVISHRRTQ